MNGIFVINKSAGMTSHDVVNAIRARFDISKVGHLGTLDPMATGVLPVCLGKATRIAQFITSSPKEYTGEVRFGFSTSTYDREGTPTSDERPLRNSVEEIKEAMQAFTGELNQIPPSFSAKKIGGVPSYKLARKGRKVTIAPARVQVQRFEMVELKGEIMTFQVVCSPGTYIRSLAHDLGQHLECGAHLAALQRTRSGDFHIGQAMRLDEISASDLIPIESLLDSWPRIEVSEADERKVAHGNQIMAEVEGAFARIFNKKGEFMAIAKVESGWVHPRLVLTSNTSDEQHVLGCILEKEIKL